MTAEELPGISVVIRAYNEARELRELLVDVRRQEHPHQKIQIIVVDNGSTDETGDVARALGAEVVWVAQEDFSYPRSLNLGFAEARHEIVFTLSAHVRLQGAGFFRPAVERMRDRAVVAVFASHQLPRPPSTLFERLLLPSLAWRDRRRGSRPLTWRDPGDAIGNHAAAIRRSVWQRAPFDEAYGAGSEDTAWIRSRLEEGCVMWRDTAMIVQHSHRNTLRSFLRQVLHWESTRTPRPFAAAELGFRRDLAGGRDATPRFASTREAR